MSDCECRDGCACQAAVGPAAFEVKRLGQTLKVCTRCQLSWDTDARLLVTATDDLAPFFAYDTLGAMIIIWELEKGAVA